MTSSFERNKHEVRDHKTADTGVRKFTMDGELWIVRERPAPPMDRRGGTHLIFESASVMRRLRAFPPDWMHLSDEELYALSLRIR